MDHGDIDPCLTTLGVMLTRTIGVSHHAAARPPETMKKGAFYCTDCHDGNLFSEQFIFEEIIGEKSNGEDYREKDELTPILANSLTPIFHRFFASN